MLRGLVSPLSPAIADGRAWRWAAAMALLVVCAGCGGSPERAAPAPAGDGSPAQAPWLVEATDEWGVDFTHRAGAAGDRAFPEMMGGGIAVLDADADGALDLYFLSGAPRLGRDPAAAGPVNRLFLQRDDGRFADATDGSGLGDPGYGTGVAVGDFDNDGHEDLFVANFGPDRLFRGRGDGSFEDVTAAAGVAASGAAWDDWSTSAAFCDFDRDGHLDLYVVRYVVYDPAVECTDAAGRREYCGPDSYEDRPDVLLRNQGDGTFRDVTAEAGLAGITGAGLGVVCEDVDEDGWIDVYVANDGDANQLWMNQGDGSFVDEALIMGASVNAAGLTEAGMGVLAADFDNDTDFDLFLTHLRDETNTFYRNLGPGVGFEDQSARVGLAAGSTPYTGFGTAALDVDLDADLDIAVVNGRVRRGPRLTDDLPAPWNLYAEPNLLFANDAGTFREVGAAARPFTAPIEVGRALATGDLDGDGDLDLVVGNIESRARLYRGEPPPGHWLIVDAVDPRLRRRALGARVTISGEGGRQVRTIHGAMSYLSSSDPRAHFGLGAAGSAVSIAVRWPDGLEETFAEVAVDRAVVLRRGEGGR